MHTDCVALGGVQPLILDVAVADTGGDAVDAAGTCALELTDVVQSRLNFGESLQMRHLVQIVVQIQQHTALNHDIQALFRDEHHIRQVAAGEDCVGLFIRVSPDLQIEAMLCEVIALEAANQAAGYVCIAGIEGDGLRTAGRSSGTGTSGAASGSAAGGAAATGGQGGCRTGDCTSLEEITTGNHLFHGLVLLLSYNTQF